MAERRRYTDDDKHAALVRAYVDGEAVSAVAESVGVSRQSLRKWRKDPVLWARVEAERTAVPDVVAPAPEGALLSEVEERRVIGAIKEGMFPHKAIQLAGRRRGVFREWLGLAERGDAECARLIGMFMRAGAEAEENAVMKVRGGGLGWQGPAWWLERFDAETYNASRLADERDLSAYTDEDLMAAVLAGTTDAVAA